VLTVKTIIFFTALLLSALFDIKKMIVPDFITYPGIILGLGFVFLEEPGLRIYYLSAGAGGFLLTFLIYIAGKQILKKEVIGGGDIKLVALIGFFIGLPGLVLIFILSSFTGILVTYLVYKDLKRPIPYAFYLSLSSIIIYSALVLNIICLT